MSDPPSRPRPSWFRPPSSGTGLVIMVMLTLLVLAHRTGGFIPFVPFHMFQHGVASDSRVVVRDAQGQLSQPWAFDRWRCAGPIVMEPDESSACAGVNQDRDLDARVEAYMRSHPLGTNVAIAAAEPVVLMREAFRFPVPDGPALIDLCPIASCLAMRAP